MQHAPCQKPWNPWPVSIITFFALGVIGCISFIAFCTMHPVDLVAADYYEQEVRYQRQMDRVQRAHEAGALTSVTYDSAAKKIIVSLPPSVSGESVTGRIHLYRPSAAHLDRWVAVQPGPRGRQEIDAVGLEPGLWQVQVVWSSDAREFYFERKLRL